jgi:hypothetical protein
MPLTPDAWIAEYQRREAGIRRGNKQGAIIAAVFMSVVAWQLSQPVDRVAAIQTCSEAKAEGRHE